ncbi:MAG: hypothetical protein KA270_02835 [Saprospiraceae bacterium]|nr:hypothetical protein [Saprospiraceae bacterium]
MDNDNIKRTGPSLYDFLKEPEMYGYDPYSDEAIKGQIETALYLLPKMKDLAEKIRKDYILRKVKPVFESRKSICSEYFALDHYALGLIEGYTKALNDRIEDEKKG